MQEWNEVQGLGIVVVTLLLDGPGDGPATTEGAMAWKQQFGLNSVYVVSDPDFSMVAGNSVGTPMFTVVDPRSMLVTFKQEGSSGSHPELEQLAQQNKGDGGPQGP
jgi:hypothetical protein